MGVRKSKKNSYEHCKGRGLIEQVDIESYKHWDYPWVIINSDVKSGMRVLDAGSGRGFLQVFLSKMGCDVFSVDIRNLSSKLVTRIQRILKIKENEQRVMNKINRKYNVNIKFKKESISRLSFNDSFFDVVFCISVLEHLKKNDVIKSVKEMNRVLKPGGTLALTVDYNLSSSKDKIGFNEKDIMEYIIEPSGLNLKGKINLDIENWNEMLQKINRWFNTKNEAISAGIILKK